MIYLVDLQEKWEQVEVIKETKKYRNYYSRKMKVQNQQVTTFTISIEMRRNR